MTILIKNVQLIDGTGKQAVKADVLVKNDKISAIGNFPNYKADDVIDGMGAYLAPGFIDINTDSDHYLTLFSNPSQKDFVLQGVTTIIGGQCGASLAPLLYGSLESIKQWANINQINVNWQTMGEFLKAMSKRALGVNFGTLVGHTTVRRALVGETERELTGNELKVFASVLEKAMREGAFGFSTGLGHSQAHRTPYNEIKELVSVIAKFNGLYATHLRHRKEGLLSAVSETIGVAKETGATAQINHFQPLVGFENDYEQTLDLVTENAAKADVHFDVYPFDESVITVDVLLPRWAQSGDRELMLKNIQEPALRKKILGELPKIKGEEIVIVSAPNHEYLAAKTLKEFSYNRNLTHNEGLLALMKDTDFRAVVSCKNISVKELAKFLFHERSIIASNSASFNGSASSPQARIKPERSYKTFAKFLEIVAKESIMTIETAVRKITSLPAQKLGLKDRGVVGEGYFADLVLFRDAEIWEVLINGKRAVKDGQFQNILAGKILKRGFALVELLITIAIAAVLAGAAIIAINPAQQLARGRNAQRQSDINMILNAVGQNLADNKGAFSCVSGAVPTSSMKMANGAGNYDIALCLTPVYLDKLPFDPKATGAHYASTTDYDTGYFISQNASTSRIAISAPSAELGETISITR